MFITIEIVMNDLRQKLLAAKDDIEKKSGQKFSKEYVALADLISEFVSIKTSRQIEPAPLPVVSRPAGKPSDDFLYGNN